MSTGRATPTMNSRTLAWLTRPFFDLRRRLATSSAAVLLGAIGLAQDTAYPLRPPDRSSPRAALQTFLAAGDAAGAFLAREYIPSLSRAGFHRLVGPNHHVS